MADPSMIPVEPGPFRNCRDRVSPSIFRDMFCPAKCSISWIRHFRKITLTPYQKKRGCRPNISFAIWGFCWHNMGQFYFSCALNVLPSDMRPQNQSHPFGDPTIFRCHPWMENCRLEHWKVGQFIFICLVKIVW